MSHAVKPKRPTAPVFPSMHAHKILSRNLRGQQRVTVLQVPRPDHPDLKPIEWAILIYLTASEDDRQGGAPTAEEIAKHIPWSQSAIAKAMSGDWVLGGSVTGWDAHGKPSRVSWTGLKQRDELKAGKWKRKPTIWSLRCEPVATAESAVVGPLPAITETAVATTVSAVANVGTTAETVVAGFSLQQNLPETTAESATSLRREEEQDSISSNREAKSFSEAPDQKAGALENFPEREPTEGKPGLIGARFARKSLPAPRKDPANWQFLCQGGGGYGPHPLGLVQSCGEKAGSHA